MAIAWILFCVLHSLLAHVDFKKWAAKKIKNSFRYYRLYYSIFAALSFMAVLAYQLRIPAVLLFKPTIFTQAAGVAIGLLGVLVMGICIKKYFNQLSGLKTLFVDEIKSGNTLIITGIHRHVRHPLYLGTFLFIWGLLIFIPLTSLLIANFIITVYTLIGIGFEEEKLIREFGSSYREYKKKVPKIIPTLRLPSAN